MHQSLTAHRDHLHPDHPRVVSMRRAVIRRSGPANHLVVGPKTRVRRCQGGHPTVHQGVATRDQAEVRQASKDRVVATWVGRLGQVVATWVGHPGQVVATLVFRLGREVEVPMVAVANRRASYVVRLDGQALVAAKGPIQEVVDGALLVAHQAAKVRCRAFCLGSLRHGFASDCRGPGVIVNAACPSLLRICLRSLCESRQGASPRQAATSALPPETLCKRNARVLKSSCHCRQAHHHGGRACWPQPLL